MIEIQVEGLVKSFDLEKKILDGLTFQIDEGQGCGALGPNGAGKTTLFRILTGGWIMTKAAWLWQKATGWD